MEDYLEFFALQITPLLLTKLTKDSRKKLFAHIEILDKQLLEKTYLVGERVTVADISLFALMQKLPSASYRHLKSVKRWFETIRLHLGLPEEKKEKPVSKQQDTPVSKQQETPVSKKQDTSVIKKTDTPVSKKIESIVQESSKPTEVQESNKPTEIQESNKSTEPHESNQPTKQKQMVAAGPSMYTIAIVGAVVLAVGFLVLRKRYL